jgi:hypothetical protein
MSLRRGEKSKIESTNNVTVRPFIIFFGVALIIRLGERLREKRGKSTTPESGSLGGASPSGTIDSGIDVSDTLSTIEVRPITTSLGFPEISSSPTLPCLPALSNGPTAEFSQDSGDGLGFDPSLPQEYFFSLDPALSDTAWAAHIDQTSPIEIPALLDNDLPPPHVCTPKVFLVCRI